MTFLTLFLLATQSFALRFTLPDHFGGKTDYSEAGWRAVVGELLPDVKLGPAPTTQINIAEESTCHEEILKCSTTYFGKDLAVTEPNAAQLWVKWHRDVVPFSCDSSDGCTVTSSYSIADLTSQTEGWSVAASINAKAGTNNNKPTINGRLDVSLTYEYSKSKTTSKTITSTETLSSKCFQNNLCYLQTGTLMMSVSGTCDSKPLLVCDRTYFVCEEFNDPYWNQCSQWQTFANKHCVRGNSKPNREQCSMNVAVTDDAGEPIAYQIFEQKPIWNKRAIEKRDDASAESPYGALPDGSSGAWKAWSR